MPWKKLVKTTNCPLPWIGFKETGSIWVCPVCNREWVVDNWSFDGNFLKKNGWQGPCTKTEKEL